MAFTGARDHFGPHRALRRCVRKNQIALARQMMRNASGERVPRLDSFGAQFRITGVARERCAGHRSVEQMLANLRIFPLKLRERGASRGDLRCGGLPGSNFIVVTGGVHGYLPPCSSAHA
jgi:hypothetical protein